MRISISATAILYHITNVRAATNIIKDNRFELKPSEGTEHEETLAKGPYYLSTTRSKLGGYTLSSLGDFSALLVLSGTALAPNQRLDRVV